MLRRTAYALILVFGFAGLARAGGGDDPAPVTWRVAPRLPSAAARRPPALPIFYASLAALQGFDGYSTRRALAGGAREANPFMKRIVNQPVAFWSVKAAMAVGPTLAAERMWKHHKAAAIGVMAISNGLMATVAAHNARAMLRDR